MNAPFHPPVTLVRQADLADRDERARIDSYVKAHPAATAFHRTAWITAVAKGTHNTAQVLLAECGGVLCGVLPLVDVRSRLFGRALVASGFGVDGGVLADDVRAAESLIVEVESLAASAGGIPIELRGGMLPDRREGWAATSNAHCGFASDLAGDDDAQLLAIPRKQRAEVRKGLANPDLGVTVGSSPEDRANHYAVYAESVRNLGTPVFPKTLFSQVLDAFGADADILTVRCGDRPVASVLSLYHRDAVLPFWGGGTAAARGLRANDRMYYELMIHARRRGCKRFDFGRSKTGSGPFAFKRNWGFEPQPLVYATWTAPGGRGRNTDPTSADHSAKIEAWKRLPLPLANLIGPWIARGLG